MADRNPSRPSGRPAVAAPKGRVPTGARRRSRASKPPVEHDVAATRARILEAAGEVFAARGYREGTVREICNKAGANVSAVAYHFGSKAELYDAVMRRAQEYAAARYPMEGLAEAAATDAVGALRRFVETLLRRLLDRGRPAWHGHLMMREMAQPSASFHILSEEMARPMFAEAAGILSKLTGDSPDSDRIRLGVSSVIGQCTVHRNARALLKAMHPGVVLDVDELAEHITSFSLAGLGVVAGKRRKQ